MSRLSRDDWTAAALRALGERGFSAVAVEPLAVELGTSKGSFYWHFARRDELIEAVIERWELTTDTIIAQVDTAAGDPEGKLRALFVRVFANHRELAAELALLAAAGDDPRVRAAVGRVTRRRVDYLAALMVELGFARRVALRRAAFAYSAFVGHLQLRAAAPDELARATGALRTYADEVIAVLIAR